MKKIVIISYFDNESSLVGGLRCFELYKHLKANGYRVEMLTASGFGISTHNSLNFMQKIYSKFHIDYAYEFVKCVVDKLFDDKELGVMITSSPPHGVHLAGLELKKRKGEFFWFADFRDPFTLNEGYKQGIFANKDRSFEGQIYDRSDLVVFNSDKHRDDHLYEFECLRDKSIVVRNGYGDFLVDEDKEKKYCYFGGVYEGMALKGLLGLFEKIQNIQNDFVCDFYGEYHPLMKKYDFINYVGRFSYGDVKQLMPLYRYGFIYLDQKYSESYRVAQKFYDYLGAGVFPVCVNASYEMRMIMNDLGFGFSIDEESVHALDVEDLLISLNQHRVLIDERVEKYSRRFQNARFESMLVTYCRSFLNLE